MRGMRPIGSEKWPGFSRQIKWLLGRRVGTRMAELPKQGAHYRARTCLSGLKIWISLLGRRDTDTEAIHPACCAEVESF
jgi:hypothetical protein